MKKFLLTPPKFLYEKLIGNHRDGASFIIFFFFLISFALARFYIFLSIHDLVPSSLTENIRGVHIHHFAWGIIITTVIGYLSLVLPRSLYERFRLKLGAIFGIGLGLTFDEFGMWMHLKDEYILRKGYDALILIGIALINIVYFGNLWKRLFAKLFHKK